MEMIMGATRRDVSDLLSQGVPPTSYYLLKDPYYFYDINSSPKLKVS
jgi:hypothetical protein